MGGKKVRNRMRLKGYIEMELQKLENQLNQDFERTMSYPAAMGKEGYIRGKIDALKWVLSAD